jgi:hypothetical protein
VAVPIITALQQLFGHDENSGKVHRLGGHLTGLKAGLARGAGRPRNRFPKRLFSG